MKCIAIDDEPMALSVISSFCNRSNITVDLYSNPAEGVEAIRAKRPDLVFLDIEMKDMSGVEIARSLAGTTEFIFTTAYLQYAADGFELDAVDFLHKPFSYDRFRTAIEKFERRRMAQEQPPRTLTLKQEYSTVVVMIDDITYLEAMENYSKVHRLSAPYILSRISLKALGQRLPAKEFVRIHRSYIVAIGKIESYNRQEMRLVDGTVLPVGRQYIKEISDLLEHI